MFLCQVPFQWNLLHRSRCFTAIVLNPGKKPSIALRDSMVHNTLPSSSVASSLANPQVPALLTARAFTKSCLVLGDLILSRSGVEIIAKSSPVAILTNIACRDVDFGDVLSNDSCIASMLNIAELRQSYDIPGVDNIPSNYFVVIPWESNIFGSASIPTD